MGHVIILIFTTLETKILELIDCCSFEEAQNDIGIQ